MKFNMAEEKINELLNGFNKYQVKSLKSIFQGRTIKHLTFESGINEIQVVFRNNMSWWFTIGIKGKINFESKRFV